MLFNWHKYAEELDDMRGTKISWFNPIRCSATWVKYWVSLPFSYKTPELAEGVDWIV